MSISSTIVNVNATVTEAPTPSTLQQSGAIVSVGGTTQAANTLVFYGSNSTLQAALSSTGNSIEVGNMGTTFFAQPGAQFAIGVYVLELGVQGTVPSGITALGSWISGNPGQIYAYLTPSSWDASGAALNTLAGNYSSNTGMTYFFVTTTSGTLSAYSAANKSIFALVPSPTAASSEFQTAAPFYAWLANNPSAANPAAPMDFRFAFGVTPWPVLNNQATINAILTAGGNLILTGAEGGISNALLRNGTTMDLSQSMFWYSVDWLLINAKQQLAAAIINGSNSNPPLYYNQQGINYLLAILTALGSAGTSFGLLLNATFTATSFATYVAQNPDDYAAGKYNGFNGTTTPQAGFESITFNVDALQFAV